MSRKDHETDELVKRLQQSLNSDTDADGTPEEVFSARSAAAAKDDADEDIAAFDSYMARLLGEVVTQGDENTAKKTKKTKKSVQPEMPTAISHTEDEEMALSDEEDEVPLPSDDIGLMAEDEPFAEEEDEATSLPDEAIPVPDARVELSDDALTTEMDEPTEQKGDNLFAMDEPSFEVLEQLVISEPEMLTERVEESVEEDRGASAVQPVETVNVEEREDAPKAQPPVPESTFDEPIEVSPDRPAYEFSDEPDEIEDGMPKEEIPDVSARSPEPDRRTEPQESPEQVSEKIAPVVLEKGDILLDAEDDIPVPTPEESAPTATDVRNEQAEAPTPVSSPLDAAREKAAASEPPRPKQSPLDAMAAKVQGNVAPVGGVSSVFSNRQKSERTLTDDDVELLLDLGYDSNLVQKVGSSRVEAVRYRHQDDERSRRAIRHAYGCTGEEYSSHTQDKQIRATYRAHMRGAVVRVALSVLLTALLLLTDIWPTMLLEQGQTAGQAPVMGAYGALGLVLLAVSAAIVWPQLARGFKALLRFAPVPASLPATLLLMTVVYDIAMMFGPTSGVLLNFPTGMAFVLLAVAELMTVKSESMTFDVVSARSRKIVMEPIPPRKKKVVRDGHIVKIINDEGGRRTWRVRPTDLVAGYFRRSRAYTTRYRALSACMLLSIVAATCVGVVTLIVREDMRTAATTWLLTAQMSLPIAALVSYAYPMLFATQKLAPQGCAIIGRSAVEEYAGEKTLLFDDTEMFRSKSSTEITIKGSGDTKKYVRYAKRLFSTLGGTLRGISTSDLTSETYEERVEILKIHDQGVEARIDGKVTVIAGTSAYMTGRGIRVPGESAELLVRRNVESSILYLAFDGKLRLGYEVDYRISGRFEQVVADLARSDTAVAVETCDPCIHDDFLTRSRKVGASPVAVVKPARFERRNDSMLCDSGVIATRSARDIAAVTLTCDRLMDNDRQLQRVHRVAMLLGTVAVLALSMLGHITQYMTLIAAAFQLVFCMPALLLSRKNLTNEQQSEKENANRNRE